MDEGFSQLDAMRLGIEYRHPVKIRGFSIMLRPLSMGETVEVANDVWNQMQTIPESMRTRITEQSLLAKRTIEKASTSDVGAGDPHITEAVLDRCTAEELQAIYDQYVDIVDLVNPSLEKMPTEELDALVESVKKNRSELIKLSRWQLLNLASRLLTSDV